MRSIRSVAVCAATVAVLGLAASSAVAAPSGKLLYHEFRGGVWITGEVTWFGEVQIHQEVLPPITGGWHIGPGRWGPNDNGRYEGPEPHVDSFTAGIDLTTPAGWPYLFKLKKTGQTQMKGTKKLVFEATSGEFKCRLEASKLNGTFAVGAHTEPVPLVLNYANTPLKLNKKLSSPVCPKEGWSVEVSLAVLAEGEPLTVELT